jgi:hypothetical protein
MIKYAGWIVRIYHNFTNYDFLTSLVDSHVDFCNTTEIIQEKKYGNMFAMTWRWVSVIYYSTISIRKDIF